MQTRWAVASLFGSPSKDSAITSLLYSPAQEESRSALDHRCYMEPDDLPEPIGEPIDEAMLLLMRPDLLEQYRSEKLRHRQAKREIERARQRTHNWIWKCFCSPLKEQKYAEVEAENLERLRQEDGRYARFLEELRDEIRTHWAEE